MRLICPNCGAQYEVSVDAIPDAGRDVQCSNCAHTWFETPGASEAREAGIERPSDTTPDIAPDIEAETAQQHDAPNRQPDPSPEPHDLDPHHSSQDLDHDTLSQPEETAPEGWSEQDATPDTSPSDQKDGFAPDTSQETLTDALTPDDYFDESEPLADDADPRGRTTVTPNVAEILRSEAAREDSRRAADAPASIESQPDLGLDRPMDRDEQLAEEARRRMARLRGEAAPAIGATTAVASGARGEMLPDVEEINSSLRSETERDADAIANGDVETKRKSGFRRGFIFVLLLALLALLLYMFAPQISNMVPALEPTLTGYVDMVDKWRLWLDLTLQGLLPGGES